MTTRVVRCGGIVLSSWRGYRYHYFIVDIFFFLFFILFFYSVLPWGRKFSSFYLPTDYLSRNRSVDINVSVIDDVFQYLSNILSHTPSSYSRACIWVVSKVCFIRFLLFFFFVWYLSRHVLKNETMVPLSTSDFCTNIGLIWLKLEGNKLYKMTKTIFELLFMCWLRWNNTAINAWPKLNISRKSLQSY